MNGFPPLARRWIRDFGASIPSHEFRFETKARTRKRYKISSFSCWCCCGRCCESSFSSSSACGGVRWKIFPFPSFYVRFSKITNQIHIKWVCLLPKNVSLFANIFLLFDKFAIEIAFVSKGTGKRKTRKVTSYSEKSHQVQLRLELCNFLRLFSRSPLRSVTKIFRLKALESGVSRIWMEIDRKIIDSSSEWVSESTKAEDSCQFYFTFIAQKTINLIKFKLIYPLPEKKQKKTKKKLQRRVKSV